VAGIEEAGTAGEGGAEGDRERIIRTLEELRWNRKDAAAALGVDRTTLWRRMKRLGLT
jgi:transcriptional regulator of acetoin/glycerol metabolism